MGDIPIAFVRKVLNIEEKRPKGEEIAEEAKKRSNQKETVFPTWPIILLSGDA